MAKGLIILNTGNGKGKTTSALGMSLRAIGNGLKVLMIQFLKSSTAYGEIQASLRLNPDFEIIQVGKECVYKEGNKRRYQCTDCAFLCHIDPKKPDPGHISAAENGFRLAEQSIKSGKYDMIILDEINYAISYGLIKIEEVIRLIKEKPEALHLVFTGRNAHPDLIQIADLVTEMKEIKHPFQKGITSTKGIEL